VKAAPRKITDNPNSLVYENGLTSKSTRTAPRARYLFEHACRVDVVLQTERDPVQWAAGASRHELALERWSLRECLLGRHGDVRVDTFVDALNALEVSAYQPVSKRQLRLHREASY
jgi:hypothetical protein